MSGKLNKKNVIAIAVIVILAIIAITGTVVFLKDRGSAEATEISSEGNQPQGSTSDLNSGTTTGQAENNNGQIGEESQIADNNQQQGTGDIEGQNADTPDNNQGGVGTATANQGNVGTANAGATGNAGTQTNQNAGATGNAGTQNNQNAGVDNIQGTTITRVTEGDDIKVADDRNIGWIPMAIEAELASAKINANKSDIQVIKKATTKTGTNVVRPGEEITYTLEVTNNSKEELKNVEVSDKIPANTTYVETDDNAQKIENSNK